MAKEVVLKRFCLVLPLWVALVLPAESKPDRLPYAPPEADRASGLPAVIDNDVVEIDLREAAIPFQINLEMMPGVQAIRLFASEDRGKTWKLADERKPTDNRFVFRAARDGLFWFAVQSVQTNGKTDPGDPKELVPSLKVYINKDRRPLHRQAAPTVQQQAKT